MQEMCHNIYKFTLSKCGMPKRKRSEGGVLPPTGAGLIRYFDEDTRGFKLKPLHIIILAVGVVIFELILRLVGQDLLGF
jgi:preprotein translocase subunit Sec61beta